MYYFHFTFHSAYLSRSRKLHVDMNLETVKRKQNEQISADKVLILEIQEISLYFYYFLLCLRGPRPLGREKYAQQGTGTGPLFQSPTDYHCLLVVNDNVTARVGGGAGWNRMVSAIEEAEPGIVPSRGLYYVHFLRTVIKSTSGLNT